LLAESTATIWHGHPIRELFTRAVPDGERPELLRISVESGKTDPVVDLSDYSKLNGRMGTWFAVTPDDSFIFLRIVAGHEIYGLSYQ
jgi:hypothetical protein